MSGNPQVYQENKPDCAHCGRPLEDSDAREQRAGLVYHVLKEPCYAAYMRAGKVYHRAKVSCYAAYDRAGSRS